MLILTGMRIKDFASEISAELWKKERFDYPNKYIRKFKINHKYDTTKKEDRGNVPELNDNSSDNDPKNIKKRRKLESKIRKELRKKSLKILRDFKKTEKEKEMMYKKQQAELRKMEKKKQSEIKMCEKKMRKKELLKEKLRKKEVKEKYRILSTRLKLQCDCLNNPHFSHVLFPFDMQVPQSRQSKCSEATKKNLKHDTTQTESGTCVGNKKTLFKRMTTSPARTVRMKTKSVMTDEVSMPDVRQKISLKKNEKVDEGGDKPRIEGQEGAKKSKKRVSSAYKFPSIKYRVVRKSNEECERPKRNKLIVKEKKEVTKKIEDDYFCNMRANTTCRRINSITIANNLSTEFKIPNFDAFDTSDSFLKRRRMESRRREEYRRRKQRTREPTLFRVRNRGDDELRSRLYRERTLKNEPSTFQMSRYL